MLEEVSAVLSAPTLVIVSVGVGSWAHSVVAHYKQDRGASVGSTSNRQTSVVTVESDVAASLLTSLHTTKITPIETGDTICCGMNCGTTSDIAWPYLRDGVSLAMTVTDWEAHMAVKELGSQKSDSLKPGPCGAAPLAALKRIVTEGLLGDVSEAEVVLFCTEGARDYDIPCSSDAKSLLES